MRGALDTSKVCGSLARLLGAVRLYPRDFMILWGDGYRGEVLGHGLGGDPAFLHISQDCFGGKLWEGSAEVVGEHLPPHGAAQGHELRRYSGARTVERVLQDGSIVQ